MKNELHFHISIYFHISHGITECIINLHNLLRRCAHGCLEDLEPIREVEEASSCQKWNLSTHANQQRIKLLMPNGSEGSESSQL